MNDFNTMMRQSYLFNTGDYDKYDGKWRVLRELYERNFVHGDRRKERIPRRIHQIWLGGKMPEKYRVWAETWKALHPEWEYRMWTDDDVGEVEMPNRLQYNTISNYGPKSDYLRYHILNQYGGLYIDTDFECVRAFDDLRFAEFIAGIGYPMKPELYVGLIASVPHHPITERLVAEVSKGTRDVLLDNVLNVISAYFFTRNFLAVVRDYMPGVFALPPEYFYPFPNAKGHERRNGREYVTPLSYAVHHWEVSWAARGGRTDWIQGERFKGVADFTYAPRTRHADDYDKLQNTFDPAGLPPVSIIYTHTFYVKQLFRIIQHLPQRFIIVTHNSDENIDGTYVVPENVVMWYAQNAYVVNAKIQALPIGLPNNRWDPLNKRKVWMNERLKTQRTYRNLVYMNHDVRTNADKRMRPYEVLSGKAWVTAEHGKNGKDFGGYIKNVYEHKFVVCPEGNGADTHRFWETLYMGSVPVVLLTDHTRHWTGLPVCFVEGWEDLSEEFLMEEWERIQKVPWEYNKMNFEYWRKRIFDEARAEEK